MQHRILALLTVCFCAAVLSCKTESPAPYPALSGPAVYVVCEGSYGNGNSALTIYYPDTGLVVEDMYMQANGHSLGDVFQSMIQTTQAFYFLCVNNSDRINVISTGNYTDLGTIAVPKPRYALQVSDTKVYVTTLYSNKVYIVNPRSMSVSGSITMPAKNPEGIIRAGGKVYVATWDSAASAIYPIEIATDAVGSPISISGRAPQEIAEDAEGMLWVLSGNKAQGVAAALTRINPATGSILKQYPFGAADPLRLVFNAAKDSLYFIEVSYSGGTANNGVYRMSIHDAALPMQAFIPAKGLQYFWGIGVHPESGNVYVADPKGFVQKGMVRVYAPNGNGVDSFATGVGPGHFLFE